MTYPQRKDRGLPVHLLFSINIGITSSLFVFLIGINWNWENVTGGIEKNSTINSKQQFIASEEKRDFEPKNLELVSKFIEVKKVPYGSFKYGGSAAWATIRNQIEPQIRAVWQEYKFHYAQHPVHSPSSRTGIEMLLHNQLTFAQSSRPISVEEYFQAKEIGLTLQQIPVALDPIVFGVNPSLNISGLSLKELRDIYTGQITNWKQVGGPDLEIIVYSKSPQFSGTAQFLSEKVLLGDQLGSNVNIVENITQTLRQVAANKGAIFYASAPQIVGQCQIKPLAIGNTSQDLVPPYITPLVEPQKCPESRNQLNKDVFHNNSYPLMRNLYVIVKENGGIEEEAGIAYASLLLSQEGQRLIQQTGLVPKNTTGNVTWDAKTE